MRPAGGPGPSVASCRILGRARAPPLRLGAVTRPSTPQGSPGGRGCCAASHETCFGTVRARVVQRAVTSWGLQPSSGGPEASPPALCGGCPPRSPRAETRGGRSRRRSCPAGSAVRRGPCGGDPAPRERAAPPDGDGRRSLQRGCYRAPPGFWGQDGQWFPDVQSAGGEGEVHSFGCRAPPAAGGLPLPSLPVGSPGSWSIAVSGAVEPSPAPPLLRF